MGLVHTAVFLVVMTGIAIIIFRDHSARKAGAVPPRNHARYCRCFQCTYGPYSRRKP